MTTSIRRQSQLPDQFDIMQMLIERIIEEQFSTPGLVYLSNQKIGRQGIECMSKQDTEGASHLLLFDNTLDRMALLPLRGTVWPKLVMINMSNNQIGDLGCRLLVRADMPRLQALYCRNNQVGSAGMMGLSKAQWKFLKQLELGTNAIAVRGCWWLTKAHWKQASVVCLPNNHVNFDEAASFLLAQWPNVNEIDLSHNPLGKKSQDLVRLMKGKNHELVVKI